jgi:hypothetical protein
MNLTTILSLRRIATLAVAAGALTLAAGAPALASHETNGPAPIHGRGHDDWDNHWRDHGHHGRHRLSPAQHVAFDRGYELGWADGRSNGYRDGFSDRPYCDVSPRCLDGRLNQFRKGYRAAYKRAYCDAYERGRADRFHDRCEWR